MLKLMQRNNFYTKQELSSDSLARPDELKGVGDAMLSQ